MTLPAHRRHRIQTEGRQFQVATGTGEPFHVWAQDEDDAREEGNYRLLITYGKQCRLVIRNVEEINT